MMEAYRIVIERLGCFKNHQYYIEAEVKFVKNVRIIFLLFL